MITPEELHAAKLAIWHPGIPATEYLARQEEAHEAAAKEIRAYAKSLRGDPVIGLLRIARDMSSGTTAELIDYLALLLDVSDPEDFDGAVDDLCKAVDDYARVYSSEGW